MSIWDAGEPLTAIASADDLFPVGGSPEAPAAVRIRAGVAWVVQRAQCCRGGQPSKDCRAAVVQAGGETQPIVTKYLHRLAGRAHARERLEEVGDALPDLRVGIECDVAAIVIDKTGRKRTAILTAAYLVEDPAAKPRFEDMQLGLTHRTLEPQQEPIVEARGIVHAVLVKDERVGEGADLQQPVPVGTVARQARDLEPHDDAGPTQTDLAHQALKTFAPGRRGTGLALVAVDDDDLLIVPAEGSCATTQRVLPLRALDVLDHLSHRGLPDVQVGTTLEMVRLDFD